MWISLSSSEAAALKCHMLGVGPAASSTLADGVNGSTSGRMRRRWVTCFRAATVPPITIAALMMTRFLMMYCPSRVGAHGTCTKQTCGRSTSGRKVPGI